MTKRELLKKLKELYACKFAKEWVIDQPNIKTILKDCSLDWRMWALRHGLLEFAEDCNWEKLDGYDWSGLLCQQPQFAEYCNWEKLEGHNWSYLLVHQPHFGVHCNWNTLTGKNWSWLLHIRPQFAKHRVQKTEEN